TEDDNDDKRKAGCDVRPLGCKFAGREPCGFARKHAHAVAEIRITPVNPPHQKRVTYPPEARHNNCQEHNPYDSDPCLAEYPRGKVLPLWCGIGAHCVTAERLS